MLHLLSLQMFACLGWIVSSQEKAKYEISIAILLSFTCCMTNMSLPWLTKVFLYFDSQTAISDFHDALPSLLCTPCPCHHIKVYFQDCVFPRMYSVFQIIRCIISPNVNVFPCHGSKDGKWSGNSSSKLWGDVGLLSGTRT